MDCLLMSDWKNFSESDEELFEINPTDYIRKDLEGSDADTRRRSATELVRGMCRNFEQVVTELCMGYIVEMLRNYEANPSNWKLKDAAVRDRVCNMYYHCDLTIATVATCRSSISANSDRGSRSFATQPQH